MPIRLVHWSPDRRSKAVQEFLMRPAFDSEAERVASAILTDIRRRGESAIFAAIANIEKVVLKPSEIKVSEAEFDAADKAVEPQTKRAIEMAHARVAEFARRSIRPDWSFETPHGGRLGEYFTPLDRVGIYVPGGTAPLASTVVMTATLAQTAGVKQIVACTPGGRTKKIRPEILWAMKLCGVTECYRIGGIQAIGLMAYGMRKIEPVQKIVGPGNAYVTAAKRQVYGTVALDLVAGPSEVAILADDSANPEWVAADLIAQSEHGSGHERAMLVTNSETLAKQTVDAIRRQIIERSRRQMIARVAENDGIMIVVVPSLVSGLKLVNAFAPEHFELAVRDPDPLIAKTTHAGAVFAGHWTPESAGDFAAGPSHVLPTGGAARFFSGLTVEDFRRRTSLVEFQREDLAETLPAIRTFADIEGLDGHRYAADVRFEVPYESGGAFR